MLKLDVPMSAAKLLAVLERRGLIVKLDTQSVIERHWHLGYAKRPGVLEVTDHGSYCELKVGAKRDGGGQPPLPRRSRPPQRSQTYCTMLWSGITEG